MSEGDTFRLMSADTNESPEDEVSAPGPAARPKSSVTTSDMSDISLNLCYSSEAPWRRPLRGNRGRHAGPQHRVQPWQYRGFPGAPPPLRHRHEPLRRNGDFMHGVGFPPPHRAAGPWSSAASTFTRRPAGAAQRPPPSSGPTPPAGAAAQRPSPSSGPTPPAGAAAHRSPPSSGPTLPAGTAARQPSPSSGPTLPAGAAAQQPSPSSGPKPPAAASAARQPSPSCSHKPAAAQSSAAGIPSKYLALDCEMVGTGPKGSISQLGRCSLVSYDGDVVYDKFIKPTVPVTDYRTRWSGIRRCDLVNATPYAEARREILRLLMGKVVVGHAVHNDFKVLGYSHPAALTRDTSRLPPLNLRAGFAVAECASLKRLTKAIFNRDIQVSPNAGGGASFSWKENIRIQKYFYICYLYIHIYICFNL
ncbi:Interferon-stimulated exonuclease-like 2 [Liparis tanakae]|uniref:Interferon-stimulated exonuclease-like 2 n=1 Tax=Liparis tanakae TaxID=230148 RepID=A0A4Z2FBT8_9TELE|nr:Interferon-stimulated exonuclease-like 2 [Liparis tanakae]